MALKEILEAHFGVSFTKCEDLYTLREFHVENGFCVEGEVMTGLCAVKNDFSSLEIPRWCAGLRYLNLSDNKQLKTLRFEQSLPLLEHLDVSNGRLSKLTLPDGFDRLQWLDLSWNQLEHFVFEGALPQLEHLDLSKNQLRDFPARQLERLLELKQLYLKENPLNTAKLGAIDDEGSINSLPFMQDFLAALKKGETVNKEHKVIIVGNGGVGKSCLVRRMVYNSFEEEYNSTHGVAQEKFDPQEHSTIQLEQFEQELSGNILNLWDFGGQDIYHATHRLFMQSDAIYLLLWDEETQQKPFNTIREGAQKEARDYLNYSTEYWLHYIEQQGKGSPVIVVKTKEPTQNYLHPSQARLLEVYPDLRFLRIDSKMDDWNRNGFKHLLFEIDTMIEAKGGEEAPELPESWAKLRQYLRGLQQQKEKVLDLATFYQKAAELGVKDPQKVLVSWLAPSGVVFYRAGYFKDQILLDQGWALRPVYDLFNREQPHYRAIQDKDGQFTGADLLRIWAARQYRDAERKMLVEFMLSCEVCFEITEKEEGRSESFEERCFVAPQLMKEEVPAHVEMFMDLTKPDERLYVRYEHDFLHYGVIQSFIVKGQKFTEVKNIWQQGILLKKAGGAYVLVQVHHPLENRAGQKQILVTSSRRNPELFDQVRNTLEDLQEGKVTEWVSLNGSDYVELEKLRACKKPQIVADTGEILQVADFNLFLNKTHKGTLDMKEVKDLISRGKLRDALQIMQQLGVEEANILLARLSRLEDQEIKGLLSFGEAEMERSKLINSALTLARRSDDAIPPGSPVVPETTAKTILYVAASPKREARLESDVEFRKLKEQMERGRSRDHFEFLQPQFAVTVQELIRAMNADPQIVHFSGHGYKEGIIITTEENEAQTMPMGALRRLFRSREGKTELVILNACYSADQAKMISEFGMYVIGNNNPITDPAAINFSVGLYNGLGEGKSIQGAFDDAMITIETTNPAAASIIEVWKDGEKLDW